MIRFPSVMAILLAAALLAGCATAPAPLRTDLPDPAMGATLFVVFDVGQADAMLVVHRDKTMLVDAGSPRDKWTKENYREIPKRLEALTGSRHLDYLVVTHYHADHIGTKKSRGRDSLRTTGLWGLMTLENVTVGTLIDRGSISFGSEGYTTRQYLESVREWIDDGRIKRRRTAKLSEKIDMGPGLAVEVVAVNGNNRLSEIKARNPDLFERWTPSENDYSVALKFTAGEFEMFSGGDLSGETIRSSHGVSRQIYNDIESVTAPLVGDVEVYRVNHHGSSHSSNPCFAKVLHPEVSIFSTGENRYRHPALRVFDMLASMGDVYITGGADARVLEEAPRVGEKVVGGPVNVIVAPDGARYWVNGKEYRSRTNAEERDRPDFTVSCTTDIKDIEDELGDDRDED